MSADRVQPPTLALDVTRFADAAVLAGGGARGRDHSGHERRTGAHRSVRCGCGTAPSHSSRWHCPRIDDALGRGGRRTGQARGGQGRHARPAAAAGGFHSDGPYTVSFVYLHAGAPFDNKGQMQMTLPKMDLPISVVEWELFVPERYRADRFAGNAIAANLIGPMDERSSGGRGSGVGSGSGIGPGVAGGVGGGTFKSATGITASNGQIVGRVVDSNGGLCQARPSSSQARDERSRSSPTRAACSWPRMSRRGR